MTAKLTPNAVDNPNARPHGGNGEFLTSLTTAQRDAEAFRLRSMGWTFQRIANELGMKSRQAAEQAVKRGLAKVRVPAVEEFRKSQQEALDRMKAEAFGIMQRQHVAHSQGRIVEQWDDATGKAIPVLDDGPKLDAIKTLIQVFTREARLQGADSPVKVEQDASGTVRIEIKGIDADKL